MTKQSRVLVWPADSGASGHYRLVWSARAAKAAGYDIRIDPAGPRVVWSAPFGVDPQDADVLQVLDVPADVVVLQRPDRKYWERIILGLQAQGVKVVVDIDDDFETIPEANSAYSLYRGPDCPPWRGAWWVRRCAQLADLVTVSTPALRKYRADAVVLPNLVPEFYFEQPRRERVRPVLGWAGSVRTHPGDLGVVGDAIARVSPLNLFDLKIVGSGLDTPQALRVKGELLEITGWVPFTEYPSALVGLDVGIVPLQDSEFNASKSCLKMIEYIACGVYPVTSPTPDNERMWKSLTGSVRGCRTPEEWLNALLDSYRVWGEARLAPERSQIRKLQEPLRAGYTYRVWARKWADTWLNATCAKAKPVVE